MALPPTRATILDAAPAGGLAIVDYRSAYLTSKPAGASGLLSLEFEPVPPGFLWLVQRITVLTTSTSATRAMIYAGAPVAQNFVDGTDRGNIDTADQAQPVLIDSSTALTVQWTGASLNSVGTVRIQYQLVQRA